VDEAGERWPSALDQPPASIATSRSSVVAGDGDDCRAADTRRTEKRDVRRVADQTTQPASRRPRRRAARIRLDGDDGMPAWEALRDERSEAPAPQHDDVVRGRTRTQPRDLSPRTATPRDCRDAVSPGRRNRATVELPRHGRATAPTSTELSDRSLSRRAAGAGASPSERSIRGRRRRRPRRDPGPASSARMRDALRPGPEAWRRDCGAPGVITTSAISPSRVRADAKNRRRQVRPPPASRRGRPSIPRPPGRTQRSKAAAIAHLSGGSTRP